MKKALVVVSFGTSYVETRKKTIEVMGEKMSSEFPEYEIFHAFTSNKVIKKIKEQEGLTIPTVAQLMSRLKEEGFKEIVMQPLHVIPGSEYSKAVHQAGRFKNDFESIKIGKPLLTSFSDFKKVQDWLEDLGQELKTGEALVLMGHGSQHNAFTTYACLDHLLIETPIYVCAVESYPEIETIIHRLHQDNIKKVILTPLMLVAGDHAVNDMSSDEKNSWKSQLIKAGFDVDVLLKGMGEYPAIQNLYIEHAKEQMG